MPESEVAQRLRAYEKRSTFFGAFVVAGMFVIIVLLSVALVRAGDAVDAVEQLTADNCFNIEVTRAYFNSLDISLTSAIRNAPPDADLTLIRELVDQARIARNSMIVAQCQEVQG